MYKVFILNFLLGFTLLADAQTTTFPSPGQQSCNSTNTTLGAVTASDGVTLTSYVWLQASCLDVNLSTISLNSPASFRNPTFCYNNGYFPTTSGDPVAIARNSTANAGNCAFARSNVTANFTSTPYRPVGLTFTIADVDNPYDSIEVKVYSGGNLVTYNFAFADPTAASFAWSTNSTGSGTVVQFNGGLAGGTGWGSSSGWASATPDIDWAKGAIYFTVDPSVAVDSVVMTNILRDNRPDINAAQSIGDFKWLTNTILPITFGKIDVYIKNNNLTVNWTTLSETNNDHFDIMVSKDGKTFQSVGTIRSKADLGTSTTPLSYSFTTSSSPFLLFSGIGFLLFGSLLFMYKRKWLSSVAVALGLCCTFASCTTAKDQVAIESGAKLFVKIVQVDKNGKTSQSKTIVANKVD
jgi:hypothetical protein